LPSRIAIRLREIALVCVVIAPLCSGCDENPTSAPDRNGLPIAEILVGHQRVQVEIAANEKDRAQGLMFRETLSEDHGMLFVFSDEKRRSFWMKNTPLSLSIAFARSDGTIVRIAEMDALTERSTSSGSPARYALEMNRGWFARHGILEGDRIRRIPGASAR
jgi:uncharacterized membrane protein (UPF0127 family)